MDTGTAMTTREAMTVLGLAPDCTEHEILLAHADKNRTNDPFADPEGSARLRIARDIALADLHRRVSGQATNSGTGQHDVARIIADIQDPGHRLHKAWAELSKSGYRRGWFVDADEVRTLLEGIRRDFPEVEHRFDPQRIGAWEAKLYPGSTEESGFKSALSDKRLIAVIVIFAIRFAILPLLHHGGLFLGSARAPVAAPGGAGLQGPRSSSPDLAPDLATVALDSAAAHWFGAGTDFATVARMAPVVARRTTQNAGGTTDPGSADHAMRDAVFGSLAVALPETDHATLRAIQQARVQAMDAAAKIDALTCRDFMTRGLLDDRVILPPGAEPRAAALIRQIAATGLYGRDLQPAPQTATVPGSVIGRVITSTGLSPDEVRNALRQAESNADECTVHRALIRETLRMPGKDGDALLRIE